MRSEELIKKQMNVVIKFPKTIAFTLIGIVINRTKRINGILLKSTFINKSERPIAFNKFILIDDNGVNILAKHKICNKITHGNHFSVNKAITKGFANNAINTITGKITIAEKNNDFR